MFINSEKQPIIDKLNLQARAENDARQNIPDTSNPQWLVRDDIVQEVTTLGERQLQMIESQIDDTGAAVAGFHHQISDFSLPPSDDTEKHGAEAALLRAERKLNEANTNYNAFKNENGLMRDSFGDDRLTQFIWALIVMVIEGMLNSFFFAPAFEHGLIGGFLVAFFISFINVGFAFLGGVLGLRYLVNHCNANKKLAGLLWLLLCLSICLLVVVVSTLFRAHVDEILVQEKVDILKVPQQAWTLAVQSLYKFDILVLFYSLSSFVLFFVGLLCMIIGLWKGFNYDDPYPGFGDMHRTIEQAEIEHQLTSEQLGMINNRTRSEYAKRYSILSQAFHETKSKLAGLLKTIDESTNIEEQLCKLARSVMLEYYNFNGVIRPTPAPAFPEEIFDGEFPQINTRLSSLQKKSNEINQQFQKLQQQFNNISTHI